MSSAGEKALMALMECSLEETAAAAAHTRLRSDCQLLLGLNMA